MLKFYYKKGCLNFTLGWIIAEKEMIDNLPKDDLMMSFVKGDQKAMETVMQSIKIDKGELEDMQPIKVDKEKLEN